MTRKALHHSISLSDAPRARSNCASVSATGPAVFSCVAAMLLALGTAGCAPESTASSAQAQHSATPSSPPQAAAPLATKAVRPPESRLQPAEAPNANRTGRQGDSWPLFRGNPQATGVATGPLAEQLEPRWTFLSENGSFEAAAAIVGGIVYIGSTDGNLYALDLQTGKRKWTFQTEAGFIASPAVHGSVLCIGDLYGVFYCLDIGSGKPKWKFETEAEIDSSANYVGDRVLVGSQDAFLYCLDVETGRLIWKYESGDQIRCFPSLADDRCFVAGCDGQLHMIGVGDGKSLGQIDLRGPTGNAPAVFGSMVYVGTEGSVFFAIDWKQAKVAWEFQNRERAMSFRSSAAVAEDIVVVGSRDRMVHALDPKSGRRLWSFRAGSKVDCSPVIVGRRVLVGSDDGKLYALDRRSGKVVWQFELGAAIVASPAVAEGCLVVGTDEGQLFCFASADGGS